MPWGALARVEHRPRRGVLRDGRLVLVARNPERVVDELDPSGRRQSPAGGAAVRRAVRRAAGALHPGHRGRRRPDRRPGPAGRGRRAGRRGRAGDREAAETSRRRGRRSPSRGPRRPGADLEEYDEPPDAARRAPRRGRPKARRRPGARPASPLADPRPALAARARLRGRRRRRARRSGRGRAATRSRRRASRRGRRRPDEARAAAAAPSRRWSPVPRPARCATRSRPPAPSSASDLTLGGAALADDDDERDSRRDLPEARELRRPGSVNLVEDTMVWGDRVRPIARAGRARWSRWSSTSTPIEPAEDPVIGPELAAARTRLGLTVDQLAERTRIRPHVIESIEVDDFAPCGGDFYARGHLRTLARVLGIDVTPLLTTYDDRYADAPINPRRVFEAELATGANGSHPRHPRRPELVGADRRGDDAGAGLVDRPAGRWTAPSSSTAPAPRLNGSPGPNNRFQPLGDPVPVRAHRRRGRRPRRGPRRRGRQGRLHGGPGLRREPDAERRPAPVRVQSSDGSLEVSLDGRTAAPSARRASPPEHLRRSR